GRCRHASMNSLYSASRLFSSSRMSSRLLTVFCVTKAVANVTEPPTSEPSTPDKALTHVKSMQDSVAASSPRVVSETSKFGLKWEFGHRPVTALQTAESGLALHGLRRNIDVSLTKQ